MKLVKSWNRNAFLVGLEALALVFAISTRAQVQTSATTTSGKATKTVSVERGEVVLVQGNDLVVKMADGKIRHFPNVPDSARVSVNGKLLSVHELKPGMKLERTITTTTTPETVKTVQTVTGTVWNVMPPTSVILTLEDGKNQRFKIPNGQKFDINGQMTDAFGLKPGMKVTATKVVETPEQVVSQHTQVTGTMPTPPPEQAAAATPPPQPPPADVPILIVAEEEVVSGPAPSGSLPKTGSELPLIGLLGLLSLSASFGLKLIRAYSAR
jgi:LPXTG-motif cell wall-anchored protein